MVSVIIPARNEIENLVETIQNLQRCLNGQGLFYEVVIVDDHSVDTTRAVISALHSQDARIKLICNETSSGIGSAIRQGITASRGGIVVIVMADGSDDPEDIVTFIEKVRGGYDCCFGNRWHQQINVQRYPIVKWVLNRLANWTISILFQIPYRDLTNACKCYSRETLQVIKPLESTGFNITVELPLKAILSGCTYTVVPNRWYPRRKGRSQFLMKELGSGYLLTLWRLWKNRYLRKIFYRENRLTTHKRHVG